MTDKRLPHRFAFQTHGHVPVPTPAGVLAVATDGSASVWKGHGTLGWGYAATNGQWGCCGRLSAPRPLDATPRFATKVLYAELRGVEAALKHLPKRVPLLVRVDSMEAIRYLTQWHEGHVDVLPEDYSLRRRSQSGRPTLVRLAHVIASRERLTFEHVRGHNGDILNEAADSLASIGRRATTHEFGRTDAIARARGLAEAFLRAKGAA